MVMILTRLIYNESLLSRNFIEAMNYPNVNILYKICFVKQILGRIVEFLSRTDYTRSYHIAYNDDTKRRMSKEIYIVII